MVLFGSNEQEIDPLGIEQQRLEFQQNRFLVLPACVEPAFWARLYQLSTTLDFEPHHYPTWERLVCSHPAVTLPLMMIFNRPTVLRWVELVTGKGPLLGFEARLHRLTNVRTDKNSGRTGGQDIPWHDDGPGKRQLAFSLSFTDATVEGGQFQLRPKGSASLLADLATPPAGTAILFDVDPELEHRITPVTGEAYRTTYAGWFMNCLPQALQDLKKPPAVK